MTNDGITGYILVKFEAKEIRLFIQTQETPNPNSLKFLPGRNVRGEDAPIFLEMGQDVQNSPFARRLFQTSGIQAMMLGSDFITVTKTDDAHWYVLKPSILGIMMEFFVNDLALMTEPKTAEKTISSDEDPLIAQIIEILETRVRPAVAQDGGDILFDSFQDGIVYVRMQGACSGCPSSTATLKSGIENMLKYYVPEVIEVQQVV